MARDLKRENQIQEEQYIDLRAVFYKLLDRWKIIACVGIVATVIAGVCSAFLIKPTYESTAKIYVLTSSDSVVNLSDLQLGTYLASDYKEVFYTREVHEQVISNLGISDSYRELKESLKVTNPTGTRILEITACADTAEKAASLANEFSSVASDYISSVMRTDRPTVLSVAVPPVRQASPNIYVNMLESGLIGILLSTITVFIVVLSDDKVNCEDDLTEIMDVPVFVQIPHTDFSRMKKIVSKQSTLARPNPKQPETRMDEI